MLPQGVSSPRHADIGNSATSLINKKNVRILYVEPYTVSQWREEYCMTKTWRFQAANHFLASHQMKRQGSVPLYFSSAKPTQRPLIQSGAFSPPSFTNPPPSYCSPGTAACPARRVTLKVKTPAYRPAACK